MIRDIDITLSPEEASDPLSIERRALRKAGVRECTGHAILRRSIDARHRSVSICLRVRLYIGEEKAPSFTSISFLPVSGRDKAVVVGAGPAGLFAALTLIENGIAPIVLERGKDVHSRLQDTARLSRDGVLDSESNYAFGEGGAGAFSDGKLYTRSSKRGDVGRILRLFVQFGAAGDTLRRPSSYRVG